MEWVEVQGKTVELAVQVALGELGLSSAEEAEVEVLQDPQRGFMGIGGRDAVVRVKPKPKEPSGKKQRRRKRRPKGEEAGGERKPSGGERKPSGGNGKTGEAGGRARRERSGARRSAGAGAKQREKAMDEGKTGNGDGDERPEVDIDEQASIIREFLEGLLNAFGLEGEIETRIDGGIVYVDVVGEQTEALVGSRGTIMQAVLELCRTVVQRKSHHSARIRLDISGYAERRREALTIYAQRLANQVLEDGEEVMLEPMNPADRKVVHDAVTDIDGVRTYSEGEEPRRSVVISLVPGVEPTAAGGDTPVPDATDDEQDELEDDDGDFEADLEEE